jgi:pimeloyl-ACP methyl ester carboxylesterase
MRTFEIILAFLLAIRIILIPLRGARWLEFIPFAAVVIWGAHIEFEGYRWQMIPLYVVMLGMVINGLRHYSTQREYAVSRWAWGKTIGMLVILGIAILFPVLLPVPQTPPPTGPYPVGTFSIMLVDETRTEIYSDDPNESRAIMLQVWYPAENVRGFPLALWMESADLMGPALADYLELPTYFLDHLIYSQSHAYANAPLSNDRDVYPLLLFSHGWNGFRAQNTYQMEELASHGYVIAATDHTFGAVATIFPDGQIAVNNPNALPFDEGLSLEEFKPIANRLISQWVDDLQFILDRLSQDYSGIQLGLLSGRLDLENVGVLGHSTGGGAAMQFCAEDPRCAAVFGMDPYMTPVSEKTIETGISQPMISIFSQSWADDWSAKERGFDDFYANSTGEKIHLTLAGTAHFDFSDLPAFSPVARYIGLKGPLNGDRVIEIVRAYTLAFFDQYMYGQTSLLLGGPSSNYPEVEFISK